MKAKCKATKLLAILLSLVMLVGLLPTTALAAGENAVTEVNFMLSGYELGKKVVDVKPAISTNGVTWYSNYASYGEGAYLVAQSDDGEIRRGIVDDTATFAASTQYWLVVWFKADNGYDISSLTQEKIKLNGAYADEITILSGENEGVIAAFFKLDKLTGSTPSTSTVVDTVDFTLSGYELNKKVVEVKPAISTNGVTWGDENKYDSAYFVAKGNDFGARENISDDTATFAADTQYWLGVLFKADDGYDISALTQEKIKLDGVSAYRITPYSSVGSVAAFFKLDKLPGSTPSTPTVVDAVDFTLNGYELGKKVVDVKPVISTSGVTWNGENEYCGAYAVWQSEDDPNSIPALIPADSTAAFAADTQYWLSVSFKAVDGYNISDLAMAIENIKLNGVAAVGSSANMKDGSIQATFKLNKLIESTPTEYTISFDVNGGTGTIASQTTSGHKLTSLPTATRSGSYSFVGWFTAASGGTKITPSYEFTADTTVYAHWTYTGSSGGGGGVSTYTITVKDSKNGTVTADRKTASSGTTVTLSVKPDQGWTLETLTVINTSGKEVELTIVKVGEKYTFKMPNGNVTVNATFMEDNTILNYFVDVPTNSYYYDAVLWAVEQGITQGTDSLHFFPDSICTRAQAVTFLWRAAGSPAPKSSTMPFTDVPAGSYYYDAVLWAVEQGITVGTSETTFSPNLNCTRAQIVTFLWRSEKSPAAGTANPFADVNSTAYYADAVLCAVKEDITKGTTNTTFSPDEDCTRAQIVTFMYRALAE